MAIAMTPGVTNFLHTPAILLTIGETVRIRECLCRGDNNSNNNVLNHTLHLEKKNPLSFKISFSGGSRRRMRFEIWRANHLFESCFTLTIDTYPVNTRQPWSRMLAIICKIIPVY